MVKKSYWRLDTVKFGLAGGIVTGLCIFLTTLATAIWGIWPVYTDILIDIYGFLGYDASLVGAILGTIYGFIDGFILTWVFALVYNNLLK